jgi:hypothetical protein
MRRDRSRANSRIGLSRAKAARAPALIGVVIFAQLNAGNRQHRARAQSLTQRRDQMRARATQRQLSLSREAQTLLATLDVTDGEGGRVIGLTRCFQAHLGLSLRRGESLRFLRRILADCSANWRAKLREPEQEIAIPAGGATSAEIILRELAEGLADIAWRPLTPRLLLTALNITSRERLRWTKDGRLQSSGRLQARQGTVAYSVPTYSISEIEKLVACPDILARWRGQDLGR